jgi:hypothetical protein
MGQGDPTPEGSRLSLASEPRFAPKFISVFATGRAASDIKGVVVGDIAEPFKITELRLPAAIGLAISTIIIECPPKCCVRF